MLEPAQISDLDAVNALARQVHDLTCAPQNAAAIGLYESMGMEIKNLQYFLMI